MNTKKTNRYLPVLSDLFYFFSYSLLLALSVSVLVIYKPFTYVDNTVSYINCNKDGKKFDIGPNFIYTLDETLDQFNDDKARKLCEYGLIKDYGNTLATPQKQNYVFSPVYTQESDWIRAIIVSLIVFFLGTVIIKTTRKLFGHRTIDISL